jgi:hypothetical protein
VKGTTRFVFFWGYMLFFLMAMIRVIGTFTPIDLERIKSLDDFVLFFAGIVSATKTGDKIVELGEKKHGKPKKDDIH